MTAQQSAPQDMSAAQTKQQPLQPATFVPEVDPARLNHRKISLALLLLATIICAAFLFSAKSVRIITTPASQDLDVSGGLIIKIGNNYLLRPGEFKLQAQLPGYYPLQQPFNVDEKQEQTITFDFDRLPGHLTVITQPAVAATVSIDGQKRGHNSAEQPVLIREITAGTHELTVTSERYRPLTKTIDIEGRDQQQTLTLNLQPAWTDITIDSQPSGATLTVDDRVIGTTPLTTQILEGERQLQLQLPQYSPWQQTFSIEAGQVIKLPPVSLAKASSLVRVTSQPSGANLTVNGIFRGQTPLEIALEPQKQHQLTLFRDGYKTLRQSYRSNRSHPDQLALKLQAELGEVHIISSPRDALLYIDGRLMGRANQTLRLPTKQHRIRISKVGYADHHTTVTPRTQQPQRLQPKLKTVEQEKWEAIPALISSPDGQQLKLFKVNAHFQMGASRRQQGRRANEVLRDIELNRAFYLAPKQVSNAHFHRFDKQHSSNHVKGNSLNGDLQPVVNVSWQQAARYCNWLSTQEKLPLFYQVDADNQVTGFHPQAHGYRLPTEAEWSWAARQEENSQLKFPWGPQLPPAANSGNYGDQTAAKLLGSIQVGYSDGYAVTAPIASFPANGKGLYDLGGNAADWVNDYYGITTGLTLKTEINPLGPSKGDYYVIRGSSWAHGSMTDLRLSFRDYGREGRNDLSFRLARFIEQ